MQDVANLQITYYWNFRSIIAQVSDMNTLKRSRSSWASFSKWATSRASIATTERGCISELINGQNQDNLTHTG